MNTRILVAMELVEGVASSDSTKPTPPNVRALYAKKQPVPVRARERFPDASLTAVTDVQVRTTAGGSIMIKEFLVVDSISEGPQILNPEGLGDLLVFDDKLEAAIHGAILDYYLMQLYGGVRSWSLIED